MPKYKYVRLKEQTWERLVELKRGMLSLDDVIQNLLKVKKDKK